MSLPLNHDYSFNTMPSTAFRSSETTPIYSSYPSNVSYGSLYDGGTSRMINRPPMPPPRSQNYMNSYSNPYNSGYNRYSSSYGRPMYNSYSPYQPSYMNPMMGQVSPFQGSFIEEAHESSREAFASIESIVNAFGSINMMIESTYCALQSSFNAVLSVAENFSRLKSQFGQVLSAFTIIRTFQWLYKKLLYLIGLRRVDPSTESAWKSAARSLEDPVSNNARKSSWPVIMFFIAVYAGPFLMWKFINSIMKRGKAKDVWTKENGDYYYAIAKYSYDAQSPEELSFTSGEYLKLAPYEKQTDKSWPLASNGKRTGVVPVNYIDIKLKSFNPNASQDAVPRNTTLNTQTKAPTNGSVISQVSSLRSEASSVKNGPAVSTLPPVHDPSNQTQAAINSNSKLKDITDSADHEINVQCEDIKK